MEGFRRRGNRPVSYVNTALVACNVAVFLWLELVGSTQDVIFMIHHGAAYVPSIIGPDKEYYRLLTCAFLHYGIQHLFSNMLCLYFIGDNLERALGHISYLLLYLGCAVGSSACSLAAHILWAPNKVSAGASGAICGVMGALLLVVIRNRGRLEDMTTGRVAFLIFYIVYEGLRSAGVDNIAHISGAVIGFGLAALLYRPGRKSGWESGRESDWESSDWKS